MFSQRSQNYPKLIPKWSKIVSKMVPKLSSNGPEGSQNAFKVVQTRSQNSPHLLYLSKLISYLHLSFSNLASIKLALINNLFLYFSITKQIFYFIPLTIILQIHLTLFTSRTACDTFSHARTLTHLCVT